MDQNTENRTIALAAIFQCAEGVSKIANTGYFDSVPFESCIESIVTENTDTILDIYSGLPNLEIGLKTLMFQLGNNPMTPDGKSKNMDLTRYAINLLHLEKKLDSNPDAFAELLRGIEDAQRQLQHFDITHETIVSRLAEIYSTTISSLGPRIMVKGDQNQLGNKNHAAKIRALLLAGIRASLLWRQAGGNRWKLMFERGKMQRQAEAFLAEIKANR
ncbi:MAG: FIG002903: a protein of unknown function perhaps involved in purine metabolism [uncultured Thiotrichaceae bacterium]|uniref:High frequency lysogenization protein HflD homolog n=1 Tax=uncultured Thiotrichaceae bacterium TaxID=298394 RepID=A0A6S6U061_9GAMM|nr:MAG: FIG002903: a protein of unknown function perhaps involved in purine metabolism [uncultured Thiotrichaceae bacterium]